MGDCNTPAAAAGLMWQVLDPQHSVLLLDTDALPAPETRAGEATTNATEAALVLQVAEALAAGRVALADIGIISPYRSQARALCVFFGALCRALVGHAMVGRQLYTIHHVMHLAAIFVPLRIGTA